MNKVFAAVKTFLGELWEVGKLLVKVLFVIAAPVLVALDLFLGTKFNIVQKVFELISEALGLVIEMLASLNIKDGWAIAVIIIVTVVIIVNKKK